MANYNSEFTGPQVDEAIQQVLDNHEDWSNKADPESVTLVAQAVVALQTAMNGMRARRFGGAINYAAAMPRAAVRQESTNTANEVNSPDKSFLHIHSKGVSP